MRKDEPFEVANEVMARIGRRLLVARFGGAHRRSFVIARNRASVAHADARFRRLVGTMGDFGFRTCATLAPRHEDRLPCLASGVGASAA